MITVMRRTNHTPTKDTRYISSSRLLTDRPNIFSVRKRKIKIKPNAISTARIFMGNPLKYQSIFVAITFRVAQR